MLGNVWGVAGLIMSIMFLMIGLVFAILKEKAASLIAGYNFKSKEERKKYDENQMSTDMRNFLFICSGIFLLGAFTAFIWGAICFWISFVIWLVYLFRNFHISDEKAFGKYRR